MILTFIVGVAAGAAFRNSIFKAVDAALAKAKDLADKAKKTDI